LSAIARIFSRARMREESGWLMMEVMMGAVVLVIAGLGIYQGLDRASKASGQNRNRSVAAYLAQQDQERMRGLDTSVLIGYETTPYVQTISVGGKNYTVTSKVFYANDSNGTSTSCTSTSTLASYLKISSIVTDPTGANGPVQMDSLLSPRSDQGGAAAQIVDRTGTNGVSGVTVNLVEPPAISDTTDASGCAQFGFLRGTNYHVSFAKTGYVDKDGNNAITNKPLTVVTGSSSVTQFTYDLGGSITATFRDNSGANGTARGRGFTVFQSGLAGNQERYFTTGTGLTDFASATAATSGTFTSPMTLFPFTSTYSVWAGACDAAKPPSNLRTALVPPGGNVATSSYLWQPKVAITVKNRTISGGTYTSLGTADVYVKDVCGAVYGPLTYSGSNGIYQAGFPYAAGGSNVLTVCADDNKSTSRYETGTLSNTDGTQTLSLNIDSYSGGASSTGSCGANTWS
jgi:Tfp pilus assembly protein PilV